MNLIKMKAIQVKYKENATFKGYTKEGSEEYNKRQLKGLELYKRCNFEKELKRNIDKYIEEYTKLFVDNDYIMTVTPMEKLYPAGYYEHCKSKKIYVDHENKCLLLIEEEN